MILWGFSGNRGIGFQSAYNRELLYTILPKPWMLALVLKIVSKRSGMLLPVLYIGLNGSVTPLSPLVKQPLFQPCTVVPTILAKRPWDTIKFLLVFVALFKESCFNVKYFLNVPPLLHSMLNLQTS